MTAPKFDMHQTVRLSAAKQAEYRDIGGLLGVVERVHYSMREVTVHWSDRGVRINLGFDDVEAVT